MQDFFYQPSRTTNGLRLMYNVESANNDVYLGLNLFWPKFNVDVSKSKFFFSWHTEQFDVHWLIKQAELVYPKPVLVAYDGDVVNNIFPDNIQFIKWNSWGQQLLMASSLVGVNTNPTLPEYKFSSLSFRFSQYKKFVTAFMLKNINPKDMILSWHGSVGKDEDLHGHPAGFEYLDNLNFSIEKTQLNFVDTFAVSKNNPAELVNWATDPSCNALVTLTNESFHYSSTVINDIPTQFPGPYLTEKTWKPLLGGKPFVSVGQCKTLHELARVGFRTDFGWDNEYDNDCGDLTRIGKIFNTITEISNIPIDDLYEQSLPAVQHNLEHIRSGRLLEQCNQLNATARETIIDFVS